MTEFSFFGGSLAAMLYIARSGEGCWLALKLLGLRNNPHDEGIDLEVAQNSENF